MEERFLSCRHGIDRYIVVICSSGPSFIWFLINGWAIYTNHHAWACSGQFHLIDEELFLLSESAFSDSRIKSFLGFGGLGRYSWVCHAALISKVQYLLMVAEGKYNGYPCPPLQFRVSLNSFFLQARSSPNARDKWRSHTLSGYEMAWRGVGKSAIEAICDKAAKKH